MIDGPLPANLDAERYVLGGILVDGNLWPSVQGSLRPDDFSVEKHRRIFACFEDLHGRGEFIDHLTAINALRGSGKLESVDGASYIFSLEDGMPRLANLDGWVRVVKEKATLRNVIKAAYQLAERAMGGEGSEEILAHADTLLKSLGGAAPANWANPGEVMTAYPGGIENFLCPSRGGAGLATPWPKLTDMLCGFQPGDLILIAGRPSMGKSAAALQIAHHAAKESIGVGFISLEMSKESLVRRLVSVEGGVDSHRLRSGCLTSEERYQVQAAASRLSDLPLFIDENRARTMPAVEGRIRRLRADHEIGLVIVDHLQLMRGIGRAESRHHELSAISHEAKHLAVDLQVPVMLLSQLNRECEREKRAPQLADLRETGSLEEDADVVVFVHRPEQYKRDDPSLRGLAEFIVAKQRNGPTGKILMSFLHAYGRFEQRAPG